MPAASELTLPSFDHTDPQLRGDRYRSAMESLRGHEDWLAANPYGYTVLDRESGEFFLRSKDAVFPGLTIGELFGITDGPLHEEIVRNIINVNGADHRRLRNLVNPALAPRRVDRYRPAMRRFLERAAAGAPGGRTARVHRGVRQAVSLAGHRRGDGRAAERMRPGCITSPTGSSGSSIRPA